MKKTIYIILLMFSLPVFAQESIDFIDKPFAELLAQAKKEKKLVFIDAYASWCGPCKLLEKNIFPKPAVKDFYNKTFINTHIDMEKGEGVEIAKKYMIYSYPTLMFVNGDGEVIQKALGYMNEEQFLALGKEVGNPGNAQNSPKVRFEKGENDPQFLETIIRNNANTDYDFAKRAAEIYLQGKQGKELSKEDISYILYFIKSVEDPNYQLFKERKADIIKFIPEETYAQFDQQIKLSEILEASVNVNEGTVNDDFYFQNAVPLVGREAAEKALNRVKITIFPQMGNFAGYEKAALEYYKNPDEYSPTELDKAAWIFSQNITDEASLKQARIWAEKSVMKGENSENTYILAVLYQKTGDLILAKSYAEMSKNIAVKNGKNTSLAEDLLTELK